MTPAEILTQIKPCDMNNPYVFISYSSLDCARVWEDVRMFQQLGYNVWLDERNLDKTKNSWKQDALNAITDPDCQLVVFYVSSNSLLSQNCLEELQQTTAEDTVLLHLDPVPFIAVDVEPVGNIVDFSKATRIEVMGMDIPKPEKMDKIKVLGLFTTTFFNSNNERVRVHPKGEPNRKLNYYEEIVASFPAITKIYEPEIVAPWIVEAEEKKRQAEEEEARRKAEEERKAKEEAERKAREEAERKAREEAARKAEEERKAKEEAARKAEEERKAKEEAERKAKEEEERKKKAEEDAQRAANPDFALADQVSKLLSRRTEVLGDIIPDDDVPPTDEGYPAEKKDGPSSLEEMIRRRLEEDKKK